MSLMLAKAVATNNYAQLRQKKWHEKVSRATWHSVVPPLICMGSTVIVVVLMLVTESPAVSPSSEFEM